jgi:hypothetical protein
MNLKISQDKFDALKKEDSFYDKGNFEMIRKYVSLSGNYSQDFKTIKELEEFRISIQKQKAS